MPLKYTPDNISSLLPNQIFVFGSNLAGKSGAGAAKFAVKNFGAKYGVGEGLTGQCYAFPTKDENIKTMSLEQIQSHIPAFLKCCDDYPEKEFLLTKIGTGLANLSIKEVALLFGCFELPPNLVLPREFAEIIQEKEELIRLSQENWEKSSI